MPEQDIPQTVHPTETNKERDKSVGQGRFEVYQGKGSNTTPELGLGGSVVKTLTRPLVGKHHHIFMDNFFTSPALFRDLLQDGIYACGTVRSNRRGFPQDLKGKRILKNRYTHSTYTHTTYIHIRCFIIHLLAGGISQFDSLVS